MGEGAPCQRTSFDIITAGPRRCRLSTGPGAAHRRRGPDTRDYMTAAPKRNPLASARPLRSLGVRAILAYSVDCREVQDRPRVRLKSFNNFSVSSRVRTRSGSPFNPANVVQG